CVKMTEYESMEQQNIHGSGLMFAVSIRPPVARVAASELPFASLLFRSCHLRGNISLHYARASVDAIVEEQGIKFTAWVEKGMTEKEGCLSFYIYKIFSCKKISVPFDTA
ncbi:hypothetical protein ACJX0J_013482, partial [Zea mays]